MHRYWKITDFCIEHLIRLAKRSGLCYNWLQANCEKLNWVLSWLLMFSSPYSQGVDLYKPNRESNQVHTPASHFI